MTNKNMEFLEVHFPPEHPICNQTMVQKSVDFARRWVLPTAKRYAKGNFILSAGCGFGADVMALVEGGFEAYGFDPAMSIFIQHGLQDYAIRAGVNHQVVEGCIRQRLRMSPIPEPGMFDTEFDLILAFESIEHVGLGDSQEPLEITKLFRAFWLGRLLRYLRPGGGIIITTPNRLFPIDEHGRNGRPIRLHSIARDFTLSAQELLDFFPPGVEVTLLDPHGFHSFSNLPSIFRPIFAKIISLLHTKTFLHTSFCPHLFLLFNIPDDFRPKDEIPNDTVEEFLCRYGMTLDGSSRY